MKHTIQLSTVLLLAGMAASAQNFNPVVEVTNTYEQAATGIDKPAQVMAVPDSLLKFNLDMDYEVRTTPYRGAYEFNPYLVQLRPAARFYEEQTLFLRLGAGYGFHPQLDAVWSPVKQDNFRLNLYARHQGYFGPYRNIVRDSGNYFRSNGELYGGTDANTAVGLNALYGWNAGTLTADVHYRNLLSADAWQETSHHIASLQARVQSSPQTDFYYNVGAQLQYLTRENFRETHLLSDGGIGANLRRSQLRLDYLAEGVFTGEGSAGKVDLIPRYMFQVGDLHLNLGLKASFIFRSDEYFYPSRGSVLFPDVYLDYYVIPESFVLQAAVTGGNELETYGKLLDGNHFLPAFLRIPLDVSTETVNVSAGIRGNISQRVHYNVKGGYAFRSNALAWGYAYDTEKNALPGAGRSSYGLFYADALAGWISERLEADVHLRYQYARITGDTLFSPPAFTAQARLLYNWGGRIKAGADLDASTERIIYFDPKANPGGVEYHVPAYADLGLYGEYGFTRKLAAWLRVGNLLNMEVQRTLFHAERGIYFSVGVQYSF